jgi:hypothetical protein
VKFALPPNFALKSKAIFAWFMVVICLKLGMGCHVKKIANRNGLVNFCPEDI